jgi:hypothetical protein
MDHPIAQGNSGPPRHHYTPSSGHCPPRRTRMGVPIPNNGKCTPELKNEMGVAMPMHPHQLGQKKPPYLPWTLLRHCTKVVKATISIPLMAFIFDLDSIGLPPSPRASVSLHFTRWTVNSRPLAPTPSRPTLVVFDS